jgi:hypothetical protein
MMMERQQGKGNYTYIDKRWLSKFQRVHGYGWTSGKPVVHNPKSGLYASGEVKKEKRVAA